MVTGEIQEGRGGRESGHDVRILVIVSCGRRGSGAASAVTMGDRDDRVDRGVGGFETRVEKYLDLAPTEEIHPCSQPRRVRGRSCGRWECAQDLGGGGGMDEAVLDAAEKRDGMR